ncbi:OmpA family protein [Zooshikella harenae]|uniref:OmpA family protein n=1 Tax=Zooshikella harenae TaxID=2827238 RepID=A0ABS5ZF21_9GAMM|nr:OmpA family protein [Zooshikella harenae]MBU2712659.1 OmpA family protein [Zooshikella harenae]
MAGFKKIIKDRAYLFSIPVDSQGIPSGEASLLPNILIAKKSKVVKSSTKYDKGALYKGVIEPLLLQTDDIGAIVNIETNFEPHQNAKEISPGWGLGDPVNLHLKEDEFFIPPLSAASFFYSAHYGEGGKTDSTDSNESWAQNMANAFNQLEGGFEANTTKLKSIEIPVTKHSNNAKVWLREPDIEKIAQKNEDEIKYQEWYNSYKDRTVRGYFVPFFKTIIISFSNKRFLNSAVSLLDKTTNRIIIQTKFAQSITTESNTITAAILPCPTNFKEDFYRIKISISEAAAEYLSSLSTNQKIIDDGFYILKEKIRFGIKKPSGDFELINGDPFSLEEAMVKQFPNLYASYIQRATDMGDIPKTRVDDPQPGPEGLEAVIHGYNVSKTYTDFGTEILGADGPKAWGSVVLGGLKFLDDDPNFQSAIDLAFSGKDLIEKIDTLSKPINLAAQTKFTDYFTRSWWLSYEDYDETFAHAVRIPKRFMAPALKALTIVDAAVSTYSFYNDVKGVSDSYQKVDDATNEMGGAVKAYDEHIAVPVEETEDKEKIDNYRNKLKELELSGDDTQVTEDEKNGSLYLRVTFPFDKSSTNFDESLQKLADALKFLPYLSITLEGHACPKGTERYNEVLSLERAKTVKNKLLAIADDVTANRINIIGKGESEPVKDANGKVEYEKSRRVVAVVPKNPVDFLYPPSREGIDMLEKHRSRAVAAQAGIDDALIAAAESAFDMITGVLSFVPVVQAFAIGIRTAKEAAKAMFSVIEEVNNIVHGHGIQEAKKLFNSHQELDYVNATLSLMDNSKQNEYFQKLYQQFHIRAMAINGLVGLIFRASSLASKHKSQGDAAYQTAIDDLFIHEYIENYILKDGWYADYNPIVPIGLDEYWVTRVEWAGLIDRVSLGHYKKEETIQKWTAEDFSEEEKDFVRDTIETGKGIYEVTMPLALNTDANSDSDTLPLAVFSNLVNLKSTHIIQGASYIGARYNAPIDETIKAQFQEIFPIHYISNKSLISLMRAFKTDYNAELNYESYEHTLIYARERFCKNKDDWKPVSSHKTITPYHQIRIIVILKAEVGQKFKAWDEQGITYIIPAEFQCIRCDLKNMNGPKQSTWIRKLTANDLLPQDKTDAVNQMLSDGTLYGVVYHPSYQYGSQVIFGTKPMASQFISERRKGLFTYLGAWSMKYYFAVTLANNGSTHRLIRVSGNEHQNEYMHLIERNYNAVFELSLDPEREYQRPDPKDTSKTIKVKDEHLLLDPAFLAIAEEGVKYPELFNNPKVHMLVKLDGMKKYIFPDQDYIKTVNDERVHYYNPIGANYGPMAKIKYDWKKPLEIVILVVSDEIAQSKLESYKNQNINWKNIPATVALSEFTGSSDKGPSFNVQLEYIGDIVREGRGEQTIKWDLVDKENASSLTQELLDSLSSSEALTSITDLTEDPISRSWGLNLIDLIAGNDIYADRRKNIFAVRIIPEYHNFTGKAVRALRPFGITDKHWDYSNDHSKIGRPGVGRGSSTIFWGFNAKITTSGDSGLDNEDIEGSYVLSLPDKLYDFKNTPWTAYKNINETKEAAKWFENNKEVKTYKPLDVAFYSSSEHEKKEAIKKWITEDCSKMVVYQEYFN